MAIRQPQEQTGTGEWSHYHGKAMSEAEYLALDDTHETDLEYVDGRTMEKGVVDSNHRRILHEIDFRLGIYMREVGGEAGPEGRVRLPGGQYRKPDCAYWLPGIPSGNDSIPSLAVEVRSPGETMASQRRNCREYREPGVRVCWLIDPISRTVEVFQDDDDAEPLAPDAILRSEHLPGFALPVAELLSVICG